MRIKSVKARRIFNSKKKPTIEITVNKKFTGSAPSGTSVGKHAEMAFPKKGVNFAVKFINKFDGFKNLTIESFEDLEELEKILPVVGANTMIALEYAVLRALSDNKVWKFLNPHAGFVPKPLGNCIGGGAHAKGGTDIQEFLLLPKTKRFFDAAFANKFVYKKLGERLKIKKRTAENAWSPDLDTYSVLDIIKSITEEVSDKLGFKINIGVDMAASQIWDGRLYSYNNFSKDRKKERLTKNEQADFVNEIIKKYDLKYVEDCFREDDFDSFGKIKNSLVCGDDLTVTNIVRLKRATNKINAVIIKPNQIGSLVKAKKVVDYAKKKGITPVISHRSGETFDYGIADLAVGWEIPLIKCGIVGNERTAKINRLIHIEKEIRGY